MGFQRANAGGTQYYDYNARGQRTRVWGNTYPLEHGYDAAGRLATFTTFQGELGWFGGSWPANAEGHGNVTTWTYYPGTDLLQTKSDASEHGPTYTYNAGNVQSRTWARGVSTTYAYNLQDELIGQSYSDGTTAVTFTHNSLGQIGTVTDAGGTHHLQYNSLGEMTSEDGLANGGQLAHKFDGFGRPAGYTLKDQGGNAALDTTYGYQPYTGQFQTITSGGQTVTYSFDIVRGWLYSCANGPFVTTRTQDTQGRLQSLTTTNGENGPVLVSSTCTYDGQGHRSQLTREDGTYWSYGYNNRNEVTSGVRYYADGTAVPGNSFTYNYDAIGNRTQTVRNGATANYSPNALNQCSQRDVPGRTEVQGAVNPTSVPHLQLHVNGLLAPIDSHGEFFAATPVTNTAAPQWFPNRIAATATDTAATGKTLLNLQSGYTYVAQTPEAFTYDLDGNLTGDGRWIYTWDAENRITGVTATQAAIAAGAPNEQLTFGYDWQSRRVAKTVVNGTVTTSYATVYDGWNPIAEYTVQGTSQQLLRTMLWGLDLSSTLDGAGGIGGLLTESLLDPTTNTFTPYTVLNDGNGNVVGLLAFSSGSVAAQYAYGPFGEVLRQTEALAQSNQFRFSTKWQDLETGLINFGFRYYAPTIGRWWCRDPLGEAVFALRREDYNRDDRNSSDEYDSNEVGKIVDREGRYAFGDSDQAGAASSGEYSYAQNYPSGAVDRLGLFCKYVDRGTADAAENFNNTTELLHKLLKRPEHATLRVASCLPVRILSGQRVCEIDT